MDLRCPWSAIREQRALASRAGERQQTAAGAETMPSRGRGVAGCGASQHGGFEEPLDGCERRAKKAPRRAAAAERAIKTGAAIAGPGPPVASMDARWKRLQGGPPAAGEQLPSSHGQLGRGDSRARCRAARDRPPRPPSARSTTASPSPALRSGRPRWERRRSPARVSPAQLQRPGWTCPKPPRALSPIATSPACRRPPSPSCPAVGQWPRCWAAAGKRAAMDAFARARLSYDSARGLRSRMVPAKAALPAPVRSPQPAVRSPQSAARRPPSPAPMPVRTRACVPRFETALGTAGDRCRLDPAAKQEVEHKTPPL